MHLVIVFCCAALLAAGAESPKPPEKLVFAAKPGKVVFQHAAHLAREKGACTACHPRFWPMSAKGPVRSGVGCASCHLPGGRAFAMKTNCARCHEKAEK